MSSIGAHIRGQILQTDSSDIHLRKNQKSLTEQKLPPLSTHSEHSTTHAIIDVYT